MKSILNFICWYFFYWLLNCSTKASFFSKDDYQITDYYDAVC